ncbi:MAG: PmoA family protein [Verrucomicrobiota bacterium]
MNKLANMLLLMSVWSMASQAADPIPDDLIWQRDPGAVALLKGQQVVWRFAYGTNEAKPCFHPLKLPNGPTLTEYRPADHPWHRALWFSWKYINGVNYWEEDAKTGVAEGLTEWQGTHIEARLDYSALLTLNLTYRPANGKPIMMERREILVRPPQADGGYSMDWTLTFTAGDTDLKLDRTPLPGEPDGKPHGGYAGLSVRFANALSDARATSTTEPVEFKADRYRGKATAMDYSGVIENQEAGIAILDHPNNLNAPTPWYVINSKIMKYYSPAVVCYQPHILKAGTRMTLRYRVFVHPGRWDAARLETEYNRYK